MKLKEGETIYMCINNLMKQRKSECGGVIVILFRKYVVIGRWIALCLFLSL